MGLFSKDNDEGLFSELAESEKSTLTAQGGLLLAAITMTEIDGEIHDDEFSIVRRLDENSRKDDWATAVELKDTKSVDECIALSAGSMNSEQQLVAIANLVDIAMADGTLANEEKALLERYVEACDVSDADVKAIVHVISIKNNKSLF